MVYPSILLLVVFHWSQTVKKKIKKSLDNTCRLFPLSSSLIWNRIPLNSPEAKNNIKISPNLIDKIIPSRQTLCSFNNFFWFCSKQRGLWDTWINSGSYYCIISRPELVTRALKSKAAKKHGTLQLFICLNNQQSNLASALVGLLWSQTLCQTPCYL